MISRRWLSFLSQKAVHEQKSAPQPPAALVSACTVESGVIPPPSRSPAYVGKESVNVETDSTPLAGIDFEHQKANSATEILTTKEAPRDKPTPEPIPLKIKEIATATGGNTFIDGEGDINKMVGTID